MTGMRAARLDVRGRVTTFSSFVGSFLAAHLGLGSPSDVIEVDSLLVEVVEYSEEMLKLAR